MIKLETFVYGDILVPADSIEIIGEFGTKSTLIRLADSPLKCDNGYVVTEVAVKHSGDVLRQWINCNKYAKDFRRLETVKTTKSEIQELKDENALLHETVNVLSDQLEKFMVADARIEAIENRRKSRT